MTTTWNPNELPTFEEIRASAYRTLGDAQDWLRSDWRRDAGPTAEQGAAAAEARRLIGEAKEALNRAAN